MFRLRFAVRGAAPNVWGDGRRIALPWELSAGIAVDLLVTFRNLVQLSACCSKPLKPEALLPEDGARRI
jgi:hypothetical protein